MQSLPEAIRRIFADTFVPRVVAEVGSSSVPWSRVEVAVLQRLFNLIYPVQDHTITKGGALESAVRSVVHN